MSKLDLDTLATWHRPCDEDGTTVCPHCGTEWPCTIADLVEELKDTRDFLDAARQNAREIRADRDRLYDELAYAKNENRLHESHVTERW